MLAKVVLAALSTLSNEPLSPATLAVAPLIAGDIWSSPLKIIVAVLLLAIAS